MSDSINKIDRLKFEFTFPGEIQETSGYKTVTLRELTPNDELRASARAEQNPMALIQELVKESIHQVDGKNVSTADESVDLFWVKIGQKGRSLIGAAFQSCFNAGAAETKGFLLGRTVKVG